jgi:hypothetical protein
MTSQQQVYLTTAIVATVMLLAAGSMVLYNINEILRGNDRRGTLSEIQRAEMGILSILTDANAKTLSELMPDSSDMTLEERMKLHTDVCYELLRHGRHAQYPGNPDGTKLIGRSYLDLGLDRWGNEYLFLAGPLENKDTVLIAYERFSDGTWESDAKMHFAPADRQVYILSLGRNGRLDQNPENALDGDDLGNWWSVP